MNQSKVVLALDLQGLEPNALLRKALATLRRTGGSLAAVKLNHHLLLPLDLFGRTKKIVDEAHELGLQVIADLKLNDIASTNIVASSYLWEAGFDAVIANPFVGLEEGLGPVISSAHEHDRGVILLVYMSHAGAKEGYGLTVLSDLSPKAGIAMHDLFLQRALAWNCDGVVVGATKPEIVKRVSEHVKGRLLVFSPGIGTQGGSSGKALKSGSDFIIVGRSILEAEDASRVAEDIRRATWTPST